MVPVGLFPSALGCLLLVLTRRIKPTLDSTCVQEVRCG